MMLYIGMCFPREILQVWLSYKMEIVIWW
jgi:hypothetical protein